MLVVPLLMLSACTSEHAYTAGQAWQRNQCNRAPDKSEVDRCVSDTATGDYESYKRQTEATRK